jgi:hypothetical protein
MMRMPTILLLYLIPVQEFEAIYLSERFNLSVLEGVDGPKWFLAMASSSIMRHATITEKTSSHPAIGIDEGISNVQDAKVPQTRMAHNWEPL